MDQGSYEALRNQTLLFFIEKLIQTNESRTLHDLSCQFGSKGFSRQMKEVAGGSQSGLKKFFQEYPAIFNLEGDVVRYKDTSCGNDGEILQNKKDSGKEAVEYFRERLLQYGIACAVPIKSLLGHRSQAPGNIRHFSGQHLSEFRDFLLKFPETFLVDGEENVMLKEFMDQEPRILSNEAGNNVDKGKILKLIEFYGNCLNEGPLLLEQMFHAGGNNSEMDYELIKTPTDLKSFFQLHPNCFQVHGSMVTLSDSYKIGLEYMRRTTIISETNEPNVLVKLPVVKPFVEPQFQETVVPKPKSPEKSLLKTRVNDILMSTLTSNSRLERRIRVESVESTFEELCKDEESLKNYLVNKTLLVGNIRKGKQIIDEILDKEKVISLDCEGVNLGDSNSGKITLVQIATSARAVFIFDVLTQPGLIADLARLLTNETVVKVMHDCRNDSVNLWREFGIRLTNVFDTQSGHVVIEQKGEACKVKNVSLNNLCGIYYPTVSNPFKDKIKGVYRHDQRFWSRRPLSKQMIAYSSCDVLCLLPVFVEQSRMIVDDPDKRLLQELIEEQVLAHIQPDEIRQRRRMRKNEADLKELKDKIEFGIKDEHFSLVLSNREMRLLKHLELSELAKSRLKASLKVAKKLEKMENKSEENSSTNSSEFTSLEYNNNLELDAVVDCRLQQIDNIEAIISQMIHKNHQDRCFIERAVQTNSTGDIVVMNVFRE